MKDLWLSFYNINMSVCCLFYAILIVWIALIYRRQIRHQRSIRFQLSPHNDWIRNTIRSVIDGGIVGLVTSCIVSFIGLKLTANAVLILYGAFIFIALFRFQWASFIYAVGLVGFIQYTVYYLWPSGRYDENWSGIIKSLENTHLPSFIILSVLLLFGQSLLMLRHRSTLAVPMFLRGKRGKWLGGYMIQYRLPVPLLLFTPCVHGHVTKISWIPFFSSMPSLLFLFFPVMIGCQYVTHSMLPQQKVKVCARRLLVYSVVLLILGFVSFDSVQFTMVTVLFILISYPLLIRYSRFEETQRSPMYVHPEKGLRVLSILPSSPAEKLGIEPGEAVYKVNGVVIQSVQQFRCVLQTNGAFCKLEIRNREGESKFVQRAIYEGEHDYMGMIFAPSMT